MPNLTAKETFGNQKAWHEKIQLDHLFPFRLWDSTMRDFSLHWHDFLEVVYIHEGRMSVYVDGTVFEGRQGDIVVINSGLVHGFFGVEAEYRRMSIFQFGLELFDRFLPDLRDRGVQKLVFDRKTFISLEPDNDKPDHDLCKKLESLLLAIRNEYYQKEEGYHLAIKSSLYEIALVYLRKFPAKTPIPKEVVKHNYNQQILERVFAFIHSNFGNSNITLEHAADAAALSKYYFTRFFKAQTGQTFHTYLSQVRINHAKEFLAEYDLPITEISYYCDFSSIKTFNRIFRTFTGVAPSTYRSHKKASSLSPVII